MRSIWRGLCLLCFSILVMGAPAAAAAEPAKTVSCAAADGLKTGQGLAVGDLVKDGEVGALVPEPGEGVVAEALLLDGSETLEVFTEKDGTVTVDECGPVVEPSPSEAFGRELRRRSPIARSSALGECEDNWWQIESYRWWWGLGWYLKQDTVPAGLSVVNVASAIEEGTQSITATRNKCGFADVVPVTQAYYGNTATWGNFSGGSCAANDGHNVADFGNLGAVTVAATCTWLNEPGVAGSSDVRFNNVNTSWMPTGEGNCGERFVIRSVTAHERGHTFGLAHVAEAGHPLLTMSTHIDPCSDQEFWLGKGDVKGLDARY